MATLSTRTVLILILAGVILVVMLGILFSDEGFFEKLQASPGKEICERAAQGEKIPPEILKRYNCPGAG